MDVTEKISDTRIRVFKLNKKLFNERALESHGLFLFRITNEIKRVSQSTNGYGGGVNETTEFTNQNDVSAFTLDRLLSRDSIEALARCVVAATELFFVDTASTLAKDISREVCRLTDEDQLEDDPYHEYGSEVDEQVMEDVEVEDEDDSMEDIDEDQVPILRTLKGFLGEPQVEEDSMDVCPICLDEFSAGKEVTAMPCSHVFHSDCIFQWLWNVNSCPICRRSVQFAQP
ncbi:hypothetical protein F0562_025721 [Nyssa sinensis]|uniref:RING-type domain-containing protein n=1 Tax=Nyssa sinensis TaxID=561372 RepID=A0A5J5B8K6_9ASTE|nr:hypothetical protein F0562_025721 [Nyssa sinensis]